MESLIAIVGLLVGAAGGAWAIVREQSLIRQLERVTAVLKDTPDDASKARRDLEHIRNHLALRINRRYRAPRQRLELFNAWYFTLLGMGIAIVLVVTAIATGVERVQDADVPVVWSVVSLLAMGIGALALGCYLNYRRDRARSAWVLTASNAGDDDRSTAPDL